MLVLSRKPGESIAIGQNIKVSVLQIKGKQVRLGIEAPDSMRIHRQEIYLTLQDQKTNEPTNVGTPLHEQPSQKKSLRDPAPCESQSPPPSSL